MKGNGERRGKAVRDIDLLEARNHAKIFSPDRIVDGWIYIPSEVASLEASHQTVSQPRFSVFERMKSNGRWKNILFHVNSSRALLSIAISLKVRLCITRVILK